MKEVPYKKQADNIIIEITRLRIDHTYLVLNGISLNKSRLNARG